jgi:hypothetical protein
VMVKEQKSEIHHIEAPDMSLTHNASNISDPDDKGLAAGYGAKVFESEYAPVGRDQLCKFGVMNGVGS